MKKLRNIWDIICMLGVIMAVACIETSFLLATIGLIPLAISGLVSYYKDERRYCK